MLRCSKAFRYVQSGPYMDLAPWEAARNAIATGNPMPVEKVVKLAAFMPRTLIYAGVMGL